MEGWISLHRKIQKHWVWKDRKYAMTWIDLLFRANFEDTDVLINGKTITIPRGSFVGSIRKLANENGMTYQEMRTFLNRLELDKMVNAASNADLTQTATQITICNYEEYQKVQRRPRKKPTQSVTTDNNKENKEQYSLPYPSQKFSNIWDQWMRYRKENNWPRKETYVEYASKELKKFAKDDEEKAIKIIRQSMANGWRGLFQLKEDKRVNGSPRHGTKRSSKYDQPEEIEISIRT